MPQKINTLRYSLCSYPSKIRSQTVRKACIVPIIIHSLAFMFLAPLFFTSHALASVKYSITGMRPESVSQYSVQGREAQREYLHFQNELGNHRFIYEEASASPPLSGINNLRQVMGNPEMVCQVDLNCKTPAFCSGNCRNMYYEMSNTPGDPSVQNRNHCTVTTFKCKKKSAKGRF
jgi:hypothetical protein